MAREVFGDRDPVGAVIPVERAPRRDGSIPEPKQVVGVIDQFRRGGELAAAEPFLFYRAQSPTVARSATVPPADALVLRVAPGTPAAFEEALLARLRAELPDWSFEAQTLEQRRAARVAVFRIALLVFGTIAAFLLLMVALGLTGVVWQGVTERIREFGLRRAKGAAAADIRRQVLAELAVLTSMAVALGLLIVLQVAALPLPADVVSRLLSRPVHAGESLRVFWSGALAAGVAASVVLIYAITLLCAWYPSRLATRIQPAEALHYE
jgi:putative ABC transport system permease protein